MTKRNSVTETIEAETVVPSTTVRFYDSEFVNGAVECVSVIPQNYCEKYINVGLFDAKSALKAMFQWLAGGVVSGGENVHLHNAEQSKYDGFARFYLGNNLVNDAIKAGCTSLTVNVNGKTVKVGLPKEANDLIGEWAQIKMRTGNFGSVVPATDQSHAISIDKKHYFLEELIRGVKVMIFTRPSVVKGEMWGQADAEAKRIRDSILDEAGNLLPQDVIAKAYYESINKYADTNKITKQTETIRKIETVTGIPVTSNPSNEGVIVVDGKETKVDSVPAGQYMALGSDGNIKFNSFYHVQNLDSTNNLWGLARRGMSLRTIRINE